MPFKHDPQKDYHEVHLKTIGLASLIDISWVIWEYILKGLWTAKWCYTHRIDTTTYNNDIISSLNQCVCVCVWMPVYQVCVCVWCLFFWRGRKHVELISWDDLCACVLWWYGQNWFMEQLSKPRSNETKKQLLRFGDIMWHHSHLIPFRLQDIQWYIKRKWYCFKLFTF